MAQQCKNCRYWQKVARTRMGALQGECRINPPSVFPGPEFQADRVTLWPRTGAEEWCGRFQTKGASKPPAQKV